MSRKDNPNGSAELFNAITEIPDYIIDEAHSYSFAKEKHTRKIKRIAAAAVLLAIIAAGGMLIMPRISGGKLPADSSLPIPHSDKMFSTSIIEVQYPQMASYPDETKYIDEKTGIFDSDGFDEVYSAWHECQLAQKSKSIGRSEALESFTEVSAPVFLSGADMENRVYSPLNTYLTLGMLAETTDGDTRAQLLRLIGESYIEALRNDAAGLWNANYCNDGATASILANSIWLNDNLSFNRDTLQSLANNYYASSFSVGMGEADADDALRGWLNEQTGGLLKEQTDGLSFDMDTVLSLASTVYFRAKWSTEFAPQNTESGLFHAPDGDVECDYMHQRDSNNYYWGEHFGAIKRALENSGEMTFILPDEDVSPDELLFDAEALRFISTNGADWAQSKFLTVNETIPKFDAASQLDLCDGLRTLGITDVFDGSTADFSPLTGDTSGIFLSAAEHGARVRIDEEGCEAAVYTVMMMCGAAEPPKDEVDFILDRPFIFSISGQDGHILFVGVINTI